MDHFSALARSSQELHRQLVAVTPEHLPQQSICSGWSVYDLVNHVNGGGRRYLLLMQGAVPKQLDQTRAQDHVGSDPAAIHRAWAAPLTAAFHESGALTRIVHHPIREMTGLELLRMRVLEQTLHSWDLAVSLDLADDLDENLTDYLLTEGVDLIRELRDVDHYATPHNQTQSPAKDHTTQLLHLSGRRRRPRP